MIRVLNIISDTNIGGAGRVILNYLSYADRSDVYKRQEQTSWRLGSPCPAEEGPGARW